MASPPHSEPAIIEQVVTEFFAKCLHIILESRSPYASSRGHTAASSPSPSSSSSSGARPRDKWFNLALRECPAALENFDLWRRSDLEPLVVDVVLLRRLRHTPQGTVDYCTKREEMVVERWVVQYERCKEFNSGVKRSTKSLSSSSSSQSSEMNALYMKTYRKSIVLLRSLYATVRLLPAYKVFRDLNSSGQLRPLSLGHKISFFVEQLSPPEDVEMARFVFAPVETPCGRLCLSVSYLPTLEDVSSEPSAPLSTQFIANYVGSPTTDPLKRVQSLPCSFSSYRRHSWSNDGGTTPLASPSPSPTFSDSHATLISTNLLPPWNKLNSNPQYACSVPENKSMPYKYIVGFDAYPPSPPFSSLASLSPPSVLVGEDLPRAHRTKSAPLCLPAPRLSMINSLAGQSLPPPPSSKSRGLRPVFSPHVDNIRAHVSTAFPPHQEPQLPEIKLNLSKDLAKFEIFPSYPKVHSLEKDETVDLSGLKISSGNSPRITFRRSSGRLSFMEEEFKESEFACPFAVDYEDEIEACKRAESPDVETILSCHQLSRRSRDAAAGALVRMLKTATPLHPENSTEPDEGVRFGLENSTSLSNSSREEISLLSRSRTTASALEELESYKSMRNLLSQRAASDGLLGSKTRAEFTDGIGRP